MNDDQTSKDPLWLRAAEYAFKKLPHSVKFGLTHMAKTGLVAATLMTTRPEDMPPTPTGERVRSLDDKNSYDADALTRTTKTNYIGNDGSSIIERTSEQSRGIFITGNRGRAHLIYTPETEADKLADDPEYLVANIRPPMKDISARDQVRLSDALEQICNHVGARQAHAKYVSAGEATYPASNNMSPPLERPFLNK